jgi:hypothetical protein
LSQLFCYFTGGYYSTDIPMERFAMISKELSEKMIPLSLYHRMI